MQSSARENYLVTEVMTATPQKLQLMLIEAAIRSARRAREQWQAEDYEQACEALIRAQEIVGELLAALDREMDPELVKKVAAVYLFVFRSLMEANDRRDETKLNDAIKVLEVERKTWRMVCEKLGSLDESDCRSVAELPAKPAVAPAKPATAPATPRLPDLLPGSGAFDDLPTPGLSLQG